MQVKKQTLPASQRLLGFSFWDSNLLLLPNLSPHWLLWLALLNFNHFKYKYRNEANHMPYWITFAPIMHIHILDKNFTVWTTAFVSQCSDKESNRSSWVFFLMSTNLHPIYGIQSILVLVYNWHVDNHKWLYSKGHPNIRAVGVCHKPNCTHVVMLVCN